MKLGSKKWHQMMQLLEVSPNLSHNQATYRLSQIDKTSTAIVA